MNQILKSGFFETDKGFAGLTPGPSVYAKQHADNRGSSSYTSIVCDSRALPEHSKVQFHPIKELQLDFLLT